MEIEEAVDTAFEDREVGERGELVPLAHVYRMVEYETRQELDRLVKEGKYEYLPGFSPALRRLR